MCFSELEASISGTNPAFDIRNYKGVNILFAKMYHFFLNDTKNGRKMS